METTNTLPFTQIQELEAKDMLAEELEMYENSQVDKIFRCMETGWSFALLTDGQYFAIASNDNCMSANRDEVIAWLRDNYFE